MSINFFQKNDPSINRDIEKKCQICNKEFSVFKREHQCKRCFRAVCSECGEHKIMVFKAGFTKRPHRGCKFCFEEIRDLADYINSNQLQFGKMSSIGNKWIKKIQKKPYMHSIDKQKYKKFTKEVFDRMWDSYNYSMRQFIGILTFDFEQDGIYKIVSDVFTIVISACPNQDFQSIAYLVIFMLCFCSPDKASLICLYLIELKSYVKDQLGLINAYFKTLGLNEEICGLIKQYLRLRSRFFASGFSINILDIKCSISIIDKIITRKKIDQIYLYLCLSLDAIKDSFVKSMDNINYCDLILIRKCTIETLAIKYKHASSIRINQFIQQKGDILEEKNQSVIYQNSNERSSNHRTESNLMTASFSEGIRNNNRNFNKNGSILQKEVLKEQQYPKAFRKKNDFKEDQFDFYQDSFSMISVIGEMKQGGNSKNQNQSRENESQQLLNLLADSDHSPNNSIQINQNKKSTPNSKNNKFNTKAGSSTDNGQKQQLKTALQLQNLKKQNLNLKQQIKTLREQNKLLKEKLNNLNKQTSNTIDNSNWELKKKQYQEKINYLKINLTQTLQKLRQNDNIINKYQQLKKAHKKLELEIKSYQQQNQELQGNAKILKNKIQSLSLSSPKPFDKFNDKYHDKYNDEPNKLTESLKLTIRDKNQQIQQLSKKNKILNYQIEQLVREKQDEKEKGELISKVAKLERQKNDIMTKMQELSNLLMAQEQQKLNLSEEIFLLKETIKSKGYNID